MLPSWRATRKPSPPDLQHPPDARPRSPQRGDADETLNARPSLERTVTAPLSTPHDAVLSELLGQRESASQESAAPVDGPDSRQALPKISIDGTTSSFYRSERTATPSQGAGLRSTSASPNSAHEPIYDPFTGALAGFMTPPAQDHEGSQAMSGADFDHTRDELWVHLSRIRELQSEIAGMHLQMEGIGSSDARSARRAAGATRRATEEWDDPGEAEEQRKAARDAEFATLAETFKGRRAAIDGIMNKLDDLSQALTTFHALPTPVMEFANSRGNTKDSGARPRQRNTSISGQAAVLQDESEREPVFPDSPASDAPSHVANP
ncbi:uncharacterized protein C8Q71DRAFT_907077 [Rhodofomes roseus]|uniref:Uncharacterized protein n=1 Tax=Rhodofomes roseus TaxID=34475 RepID=A0ABQ8KGN4_9APHY|nr:uncharacterized protein C8Q71DRAFT_907077 [Rhodofomes roseus]KAH9837021.1 hypothetical protein C8Q71DRAFT_907077 [Rhodofomes roseus]